MPNQPTIARPFPCPALLRLSLVAWQLLGALSVSAQSAAEWHSRADLALQSFLLKFWSGGSQYLRNNYPDTGALTGYWTYANGFEAALDGVERTGGAQYRGWIEAFYEGQNRRGWFVDYYDDECWMTVALLRAHDLTGETKYLTTAKLLYGDIMAAWDGTCCGSVKGGVWWDRAHTQKAAAANAGAALAGARLYLKTRTPAYLDFARQVYGFWHTNMVNLSTYQVSDHINPDGTQVWWKFTYNEGLMIGAALDLHEATGDTNYLAHAHAHARFMINNEVANTGYGKVLHDGSNTGCAGDCAQFKSPAYRHLLRLYERDTSKTEYLNVLRASANAVWNLSRNPSLNLFSISWTGPATATAGMQEVNAACAVLNRYAQLVGPYPGTNFSSARFEVEDATLKSVLLEANYGTYSGWGYAAGWNGAGEIEFQVVCPTTTTRTLSIRYAGGAGNASRLVRVNGQTFQANRTFTGTGSWSAYATNVFGVSLPAGTNSVALVYDASKGSGNWLNVDQLLVSDMAVLPIQINQIQATAPGVVALNWSAFSGGRYRVQQRGVLGEGTWTDASGLITATGTNATAGGLFTNGDEGYFRVVQP
jgi:predicted alpha-1,6-mannanase (GH76 family)